MEKKKIFKSTKFLIIILFIYSFVNCSKSSTSYFRLFNDTKPIIEIGSDEENMIVSMNIYKLIDQYYIDFKNNIYVGDIVDKKIDKFDKNGKYICSFGRKGQGPGEFSNFIPPFAVDSKGFLYVSFIKTMTVFKPDGSFYRNIHFPDKFQKSYVMRIKIDYMDNIYILFNNRNRFTLVKTDATLSKFFVIHEDEKREYKDYRIPNAIGLFKPDFDFDEKNNLYITDIVDYKIYIYSPQGNLVKIYEKKFKKHKITKKDLIFPTFKGDEVLTVPEVILSKLKGNLRYFPAIFGINIDTGKIYIWNSNRDKECKFYIDIYNKDFKFIGRSSYYNDIKRNWVMIRNNIFYIPNIQNDDIKFKKRFGRFVFYNIPYKILGYKINLSRNVN